MRVLCLEKKNIEIIISFIVNTPKKELFIFSEPKSCDNLEYKTTPSTYTITNNRA